MRMWNVEVTKMCNKHLLGEHVEMHMFVGAIEKGKNLRGYIDNGLVEIQNIKKRHDQLAEEIIRRGKNHNSPLENPTYVKNWGKIDVKKNEEELNRRCPNCKF